MSYSLNALLSLSIGVSAIIACIRFKRIASIYLPFLILICIGFINEIISIMITTAGYSNAIIYNIYSLIEAILITWQLKKWDVFEGNDKQYYSLQFSFVAAWLIESFLRPEGSNFNSFFLFGYPFIITLLSINMINKLIVRTPHYLYRNPKFLICIAMIIFFTYAVLVEAFWFYGVNQSQFFRVRILEILAYINLFTNIIYAVAIIWMPMKREYIL